MTKTQSDVGRYYIEVEVDGDVELIELRSTNQGQGHRYAREVAKDQDSGAIVTLFDGTGTAVERFTVQGPGANTLEVLNAKSVPAAIKAEKDQHPERFPRGLVVRSATAEEIMDAEEMGILEVESEEFVAA